MILGLRRWTQSTPSYIQPIAGPSAIPEHEFALLLEFLQRLPDLVRIDLCRSDVVQLHDVDAIRLEPFETFFRGELDVCLGEILLDLTLPLAIAIVIVKS